MFHPTKHGFALVITLSLMVLLTLLAVGLLSLSGIALRAGGLEQARATARANARLALLLALGDLQKHAGPDQRITARSDILDELSPNARLTGVWDSWPISATAPPSPTAFERTARDTKFRSWLVSALDRQTVRDPLFPTTTPPAAITLWGRGSLGPQATAANQVRAGLIPLPQQRGALAWAVADEGVKVRVDTPFINEAPTMAAKTAQLAAGERPGVEFLNGLDQLGRDLYEVTSPTFPTIAKGITPQEFQLAINAIAPGIGKVIKPLADDITVHSVGLFTDAARGGLKQDFHLLTNAATLPTGYKDKGVYVSRLGLTTATAVSDPRWESLQQFARLYRDKVTNTGGVPMVKALAPAAWVAATPTATPGQVTVNRAPPPGVLLLPAIAKVQMIFSLIGRDLYSYPAPAGNVIPPGAAVIHGPQGGNFQGTKFNYDLHLLYTPVVTLHNPYNVAIELNNLRLEFVHVPFSMQIFRDGVAQSNGMVPFEHMFADNDQGQTGKIFGMNLKTKSSSGAPGGASFRLLPGEVKLFSPYLDPSRTYGQDLGDRKFWDIYVGSGITNNIDAIPGWRGDGIGYDCDWVVGNQAANRNNFALGSWEGCLGLAREDKIHVTFVPLGIALAQNKFVVQLTGSTGTSAATSIISAIEVDYEKSTGLQETILGKDVVLRYPKEGTIRGIDMVDHYTTPIKDIKQVKPFAMLSAQAKTTSGARDATLEDGRLAAKPWAFAHATIGAVSEKVVTEHPANHSHEIDLQRLDNGTTNLLQIDNQDRGNFMTGHTGFNGVKFGCIYGIPLGPIASFPALNGANPGGSSGYLPRFAQPIGNSWAHPLITPSRFIEPRTGGNYLDHSYLLNLALYDTFYLSGLADQIGPFGSGKTTATLGTGFAAGERLTDPRLRFHRPGGAPAATFANVLKQTDAAAATAAWQLMVGAFNVNSTSVPAWKAMLASIHDSQAHANLLLNPNQPPPAVPTTRLTPVTRTGPMEARISRFAMPVSPSAADGGEPQLAYWLGPREYSDVELERLAQSIVKQVRLRGPFLSMAEFVNRRLGTDETAQRGALQQAIDDANLNRPLAETANGGFEIPAAAVTTYKYVNPPAGSGSSYQGAPGYLSQADVLTVLGNAATVRSDTFIIRGYGEARDTAGRVLATATCEAVVQRYPEWLDSADPVPTAVDALKSVANKTFGRRFEILAFRWLNRGEI